MTSIRAAVLGSGRLRSGLATAIRAMMGGAGALLCRLPASWGPSLTRWLAEAALRIWPGRRRVAEANLHAAWPDGPPTDARAVFRHLARTAWEIVRLPRYHAAHYADVRLGALDVLTTAIARNRGVVIASGHLGSWELAGAVLAARLPVPVHLVVKRLGPIDGWVNRQRNQAGVRTIFAEPPRRATRSILQALRRGEVVVVVIDQHAPRAPAIVPFFGRPAATLDLPARLALRTAAALVWVAPRRLADGGHQIDVEAIDVEAARSAADSVVALTRTLNVLLEAAIRRAPSQWLWTHRRWKLSTREGAPVADGR